MDVRTPSTLPLGSIRFESCIDLPAMPEEAFALLCAVEKWPAWLPLVRSAELRSAQLALGSEILVRLREPRDEEQLFELDRFISNHCLTLVGAFSSRRRIDFRIERQSNRARLRISWHYPTYHGALGRLLARIRRGRQIAVALDRAAAQFLGLLEASIAA